MRPAAGRGSADLQPPGERGVHRDRSRVGARHRHVAVGRAGSRCAGSAGRRDRQHLLPRHPGEHHPRYADPGEALGQRRWRSGRAARGGTHGHRRCRPPARSHRTRLRLARRRRREGSASAALREPRLVAGAGGGRVHAEHSRALRRTRRPDLRRLPGLELAGLPGKRLELGHRRHRDQRGEPVHGELPARGRCAGGVAVVAPGRAGGPSHRSPQLRRVPAGQHARLEQVRHLRLDRLPVLRWQLGAVRERVGEPHSSTPAPMPRSGPLPVRSAATAAGRR